MHDVPRSTLAAQMRHERSSTRRFIQMNPANHLSRMNRASARAAARFSLPGTYQTTPRRSSSNQAIAAAIPLRYSPLFAAR
ncbi:hypothetical protein [Burkholderia ambifaria]|uniref:hypothetical protein n=1 Tax=Burkholderia ambifaria TaxID=152480 RepID=UPI0015888FDD|nr:hypothetical protein [Burkholderia ambifaria]